VTMADGSSFQVFISYKSSSSKEAQSLYNELESVFGHRPIFMDNQAVRPGHVLSEEIEAALCECKVLLLIVVPGLLRPEKTGHERDQVVAREKDWVLKELRLAMTLDQPS
jgi:hypothetical protein